MQQMQLVMKSYFNLNQWWIIIVMSSISVLINLCIPIKSITQDLNIPGPAAGTAAFGGLSNVAWVCLSRDLINKRGSGLVTALITISLLLLSGPWYNIEIPSYFSVYGVIAFGVLGLCIETFRGRLRLLGGGLANLSCLVVTYLAIGLYFSVWPPLDFIPVLGLLAFTSGLIGPVLSSEIVKLLRNR